VCVCVGGGGGVTVPEQHNCAIAITQHNDTICVWHTHLHAQKVFEHCVAVGSGHNCKHLDLAELMHSVQASRLRPRSSRFSSEAVTEPSVPVEQTE
jgi:hypothetical protein